MENLQSALTRIQKKENESAFFPLYGNGAQELEAAKKRYAQIAQSFSQTFENENEICFYSAPGRTEIGGNHTDHNHGRVLAAAVNLDVVAAAAANGDNTVRLKSEGFDGTDVIDLSDLSLKEEEKGTSAALVRGVCSRMAELGYKVGGFDAFTASRVLKGSGLSSSAAFEVLVVAILSHLYNEGSVDAVTAAKISQYAENVYFGKPCGLMDQMASSVGGFSAIDFNDPLQPVIEKIDFDLAKVSHALCIVDTGGNHADLTPDYAAIPQEMKAVASLFGKEFLRDVDKDEFMRKLRDVRAAVGDRAALRALHFFADNERVEEQAEALKNGNFETFKDLSIQSGRSSFMYLQNVFSSKHVAEQGLSLALALSEGILQGWGSWRVHGGGFAGTIQAFVPYDLLEPYKSEMEAVFGAGSCHVLSIRSAGGVKVQL